MPSDSTGLDERFGGGLGSHWHATVIRRGSLEFTGASLRLVTLDAERGRYSDAQIEDYHKLPRRRFPWRPPLRLTVRARFWPEKPLGTAGFGFWNDPWTQAPRLPALPRALWYFYGSQPSNLKLDVHTPGWGFKAASIDVGLAPVLMLSPLVPFALPFMRVGPVYRALWPVVQRLLKIREAALDLQMDRWHTYEIEWASGWARFLIDGKDVLRCPHAPRGPLGLVIWIDNQYMEVTPWGGVAHGTLSVPGRQSLEIELCRVETGL